MKRNALSAKRSRRPQSATFARASNPVTFDRGRIYEPRFPAKDRKPARRRRRLVTADREQPAYDGLWHIAPAGNRSQGYLMAKRALDIGGALALLAVFSPLLIIVLVVLMVTTGGHPIFFQERLGFLGRRFRLYKFRTMVLDAEKLRGQVKNEQAGPVFKNRRDPRVTRFGCLLRRTSLDEFPQLINVIRGEMSLIGPRPPLAEEVLQYTPIQRKRLAVMPGLSCLWQVSGRNEITFSRWMQMDLWYVKHQNLLTDLAILLRTPGAVRSQRGAH